MGSVKQGLEEFNPNGSFTPLGRKRFKEQMRELGERITMEQEEEKRHDKSTKDRSQYLLPLRIREKV